MSRINRRTFLARTGWAALGVGAMSMTRFDAAFARERKPNFIFILMDDMGWADLGCYGSTFYETPNIDKLANQGMRFTNAYSACPVCSPTRASILTGKYPARICLTDWIPGHHFPWAKLKPPAFHQELPLCEITIAETLKRAGYVTANIGKWHLGKEGYFPEKHGFDLNFGGTNKGSPPSYFYPYNIPTIPSGKEGEYLTDRLTDEAENFIEKNRDKQFFLYLPHFAVHTPLQAKEEYIRKYESKPKPKDGQNNPIYAAMIQSVDESVGRIMAKLEDLKIADNTVIIFNSDNGGYTKATSNAPLRAGKGTLYEGGIRDPLIIRWPGKVEGGGICDEVVTSTDYYRTICEIAGVKPPENQPVDGLSIVPLLMRKGGLERKAVYWHYPHYHPGGTSPAGAIRCGDWKLIEYFEDGHVELYNLKDDISETTDLASKLPDKAAELKKMLA
ncbi:MAG: sulfatase, partial [Armatimonadota bacterium]|nr:sulfatase [Armatimonadota bacterium]